MNIAILGAGNVGSRLGKVWANNGHNVSYGLRNPADPKYQSLAGPNARLATVREATQSAEYIVLATPWGEGGSATRQTLQDAGQLQGKILIDCTNPLKADLSGLQVGTTTSGGELVASWAPGASVYKAFNTTGADNMSPDTKYPQRPVMFVAGDDEGHKPFVMMLVSEIGFDARDVGPLSMARTLEPLALLWIHLAVYQKYGTHFAFSLMD
jgi:predicted dinucleotide-binding enzyme